MALLSLVTDKPLPFQKSVYGRGKGEWFIGVIDYVTWSESLSWVGDIIHSNPFQRIVISLL